MPLKRPLKPYVASFLFPRKPALASSQGTSEFFSSVDHTHSVDGPVLDGVTARAGGGQALATALTGQVNRITVCASANDSVRLPVSVAGYAGFMVINDTANSLQVFGAGADTINNVAAATGVAVAAGKSLLVGCPVAGKWFGGILP